MDDDDDDFLYRGDSQTQSQSQPTASLSTSATPEPSNVSQPQPVESAPSSNGIVSHLEDEADAIDVEQEEEQEDAEEASSDEDDDIEIIMDQPSRSLDFRNRPQTLRPATSTANIRASQQPPSQPQQQMTSSGLPALGMTTEYIPNQRDDVPPPAAPVTLPGISTSTQQTDGQQSQFDDNVDPNTLPPALAPPSQNSIDPDAIGTMDGRSIIDVDLSALADKPWRRPGSDLGDWFNYGFDEVSWEAYCYRRRDIGDLATVLKANVLNFSGMGEEQVQALPPEVRQMVMTGTSAMMNGGMGAGMMGGMDGMGQMGMGGMGGMNPMDMGMMMQGQEGPVPGNGTPDMGGMGVDNGMMMGDYMQDPTQMQQQPMYNGMDNMPQAEVPVPQTPVPVQAPVAPRPDSSAPSFPRGPRGPPPTAPSRGGRAARGRGGTPTGPAAPARPASPLPPGVPTGPRSQNKYKDRDNNTPAVDGLDYGGNPRHSSGEPDERSSSRKRRTSVDDIRSSKRR